MRVLSLFLVTLSLACQSLRAAEPAQSPLAAVLSDYWQDQLKHDPEMASALGDHRYDDQLSDYSAAGYNASLDRGRSFLERLGAIDTAGLSDEDKKSKDQLVNLLVQEQDEGQVKPWETPITEKSGLPFALPILVKALRFESQADYDHYIDRLKAVPTAFEQITTDLMTGIDDDHVLSKDEIDSVMAQVNAIATQKPADSVFARPIKNFPASVSAADRANDQDAVTSAITRQVLPSYARLGKFLKAQYAPHGKPAAAVHPFDPLQQEILDLRAEADTALGARLDLKALREQVAAAISLPPDALKQRVEAWIAQQAQ